MPRLHWSNRHATFRGIAGRTPPDSKPLPGIRISPRKSEIMLLLQDGPASRADLAAALELQPNSLTNYLQDLEAEGLIERKSAGRTAVWAVT